VYDVPVAKGRLSINDFGTAVTDQDSTVIAVNDSLTIVVRFR